MILRLNKWFLAVCCVALLVGSASAQKGGGSPAEPAVKYNINWLGNPRSFVNLNSGSYYPHDMNNAGHIVGVVEDLNRLPVYSAFVLYTAQAGMIDLNNSLFFPAITEWSNQGWTAHSADGINDDGQMAVRMRKTVDGVITQGLFRYDPVSLAAPAGMFVLIQGAGVCNKAAINRLGEIAFNSNLVGGICSWMLHSTGGVVSIPIAGTVMDLNNSRQIVGRSNGSLVQYDARTSTTLVLGLTGSQKASINTIGEVAFPLDVPKGSGVQTKPARFSGGVLQILRDSGHATDINSEGDVCGSMGSSLFVFPRQGGTVVVDREVTGSPTDVNKWNSAAMKSVPEINDRNSTGFGQVCGAAWVPNGFGYYRSELFLLTPF